jgi:SAM-dependent methyltransferase
MALKRWVPWWAKIGAKILLSRTGIDYTRWQRLGLFVHGAMDRPAYALGVVRAHLARVGWSDCRGRTVLELGPGDSLATALIARALGATRVYLVDAGRFATADLAPYRELQRLLEEEGLDPPDVASSGSLDEMLRRCEAEYFVNGLDGLRRVAAGSVDLLFSQAVLEHVRLCEFDETQREIRRVLAPGGVASHQVDLKDHVGGALNSLRFSHARWEGPLLSQSGFYTNRLRFSEILASMDRAGLVAEVTDAQRWRALPTPKDRMALHFRRMSNDELAIKQFDCIARPRA